MLLGKNQLINNIKSELSDNASQAIEPYHIRHNLLDIIDSITSIVQDVDLNSNNYGTPATRTTTAGQFAIERLHLNNYQSIDNSAFGFSALRTNFEGERNTAVGSQSLYTNVYGSDNNALGYYSCFGNTTGSNNLGIGNYTLLSNRTGNYNIAIGHGAGYYVGPSDSYKFFLGSADVDDTSICADPSGLSIKPLMYGDLQNNKLVINSDELTSTATVQTSGDIAPSVDNSFSLGLSNFYWSSVRSNNVYFSDTQKFSAGSDVTFNFDLVPEIDNDVDLGTTSHRIKKVFAYDLDVTNNATIGSASFVHSTHYLDKTIHLGSQASNVSLDGGGPNSLYDYIADTSHVEITPHLSDSQLVGAGMFIHSSDGRDYTFTFQPHNLNTNNFLFTNDVLGKSFWDSNVSIELGSECYLKSNYIISSGVHSVNIVSGDTCHALDVSNSELYFGDRTFKSGNNLGFGNVTFVARENTNEFVSSLLSPSSGVISQRLLSQISGSDDTNFNNPYLGFAFSYTDKGSSVDTESFLSIQSHSLRSGSPYRKPLNKLLLSRDDDNAILKITNLDNEELPDEALHVETSDSTYVKIAASGESKNAGVLLSNTDKNSKIHLSEDYVDITYNDASVIRSKSSSVGILNETSGSYNFYLSIGDALNTEAAIGLHHASGVPSSAKDYGSLFVKEREGDVNQSSDLMFIDSSGNLFNLVRNSSNPDDGLIFSSNKNTSGGSDSFSDKESATGIENTGFGASSLKSITEGSQNTFYGSSAGESTTTGSNNVAIGKDTFKTPTTLSHNICIGPNVGNSLDSDYNFILGISDGAPLLRGKTGPSLTETFLELPTNGLLKIQNISDTQALELNSSQILVSDTDGSDHTDTQLNFKFKGNQENTLFTLDHSHAPLDIPVTHYDNSSGPYAEVRGHLKVLGSIKFADGTVIESGPKSSDKTASELDDDRKSLENRLDSLVIEGTAASDVPKASNVNTPQNGIVNLIGGGTASVKHRDTNNPIKQGDYIIAIKIGSEYRPISVSSQFNIIQC